MLYWVQEVLRQIKFYDKVVVRTNVFEEEGREINRIKPNRDWLQSRVYLGENGHVSNFVLTYQVNYIAKYKV